MRIQDIKAIDIGHRQMTFGFDDTSTQEQSVMDFINDTIQARGHAVLNEIVEQVHQEQDIAESFILQIIFWAALELKLHFRTGSRNVIPLTAKQILIDSPDKYVEIIPNKLVSNSVFRDMIIFYNTVLGHNEAFTDQYLFSRSLLNILKKWKDDLVSHQKSTEKKGYPGSKIIHDSLTILSAVLLKQDSYSFILSCHRNRTKLRQTDENIRLLSRFYPAHVEFWGDLITSIELFEINIEKIRQNPDVLSAYNTLTQIAALPDPYDHIDTAREKFKVVRDFNDIIEQEKLEALKIKIMAEIDSKIETLNRTFQKTAADPDRSNACLYKLRQMKIRIEHARSIQQVNQLFCDAKDLSEDFLVEFDV